MLRVTYGINDSYGLRFCICVRNNDQLDGTDRLDLNDSHVDHQGGAAF